MMIKRALRDRVMERMNRGKAILLIGARQVGKTTMLKRLVATLDETVLEINCDIPEMRVALDNPSSAELAMLVGNFKVIMIDEAQRVANVGLTLKRIVDTFPEVQLLVTGSSSLDLRSELNETLTGRKYEFTMYPISTGELLATEGLLKVKGMLDTRLIYGSYPEVITHPAEARELLTTLSDSYLYKDILEMEKVRRPELLNRLLTALALQIGSEVSYNELAKTVGSDNKTVEKYIDLLEKCYVVFKLGALSRNLRNELKKSRKIYFVDNGIRNAVLQNFAHRDLRSDMGALWENFFISERKKFNHYSGYNVNCYFWRTTAQQEVDYVEERDGALTLFELKWNPRKKNVSFPKSLLDSYNVAATHVVTPENYLEFLSDPKNQ